MQELYTDEIDRIYDDKTLKQKAEVEIVPNSPIKPIGIAVETKEKLASVVLESEVQKTPVDQAPTMPGAEVPQAPVATAQVATPAVETPQAPVAPTTPVAEVPQAPVAPTVETQAPVAAPETAVAPATEVAPAVETPVAPTQPEVPAIDNIVNETQTVAAPAVENVIETPTVPETETVSALDAIPAVETPVAAPAENTLDTVPVLDTLTETSATPVVESPVENKEELEDLSPNKFVQAGPTDIPPAVNSDVITESPLEDMTSPKSLDEVTFSPTEPNVEEPKKEEVAPVTEEVVEPVKMPDLPEAVAEGPMGNEDALFEIPKADGLPELGNDNNIPNFNNLENPMVTEEPKLDVITESAPKEVVADTVADTPFEEPAVPTNIGVDTLGSTIGSVLNTSPVEQAIEVPKSVQDDVLFDMEGKEKVLPDIVDNKESTVTPETLENVKQELFEAMNTVFDKYMNLNTTKEYNDLPNLHNDVVPKFDEKDILTVKDDEVPVQTEPTETKIPDDIKSMMDNPTSFLGNPETPVQSIGTKFI